MQRYWLEKWRFLWFLCSVSLQPDGNNPWYFNNWLIDLTEFILWNFRHQDAKI